MSGIVGIVNLDGRPIDRPLLERLTAFMAFRGPDDQDVWLDGNVGLGHTMLRTTFESTREHQPCSLDGHVWITADARIDGRTELIRTLDIQGHRGLDGVPDVELILHAYRVWGEECVKHLIGDFAFAIWDKPRRRLFCARDHFGVKPFYYAQVADCLVFSNTLNCIRRHPVVSDELNDLAVADFLLWDYNQDEGTTTFADINRLPPAHSVTWSGGAPSLKRYWALPVDRPIRYKRSVDYVEHFKEIFRAAVGDRLRSNHIAVSMSGGLDSTAVAATALTMQTDHSTPVDIEAYTAVYDRLMPDRERYYSGLVGKALGLPVHYLTVDDYKLYERWDQPDLRWPEPASDPLLAISVDLLKLVGARSRVMLTGDGGDPLLMPSLVADLVGVVPLGQLIESVGQYVITWRRLPPLGIRSKMRRRIGTRDSLPPYPKWLSRPFAARMDLPARWEQLHRKPPTVHPIRPSAYRQFTAAYWPFLFEHWDPGATSIPVEVRHPFFDLRLVTYALAVPPVPWCANKALLRLAMRGMLPESVRCRPKTSLVDSPLRARLQHTGAGYPNRFVPAPELVKYVDGGAVPQIIEDGDPNDVWMNLRPRSLNYWLHHSRPANQG